MWLVAAALGAIAVASRLLPWSSAVDVTARAAPILVFLVAMTVLADLADAAQVFDVVASRAARVARGRVWLLYGLVLLVGAATTILLSLDTTAVLFTPVVLALATQLTLDPLPFAFAAVWLANTASLLLPVSNLTNLLAIGRVGLSAPAYAGRMSGPALAAFGVTCAGLAVWHHRRLRGRYAVPERPAVRDGLLFGVALAACLLLAPALLLGLPAPVAAAAAAAVVAMAFAVRQRVALTWRLVPWRLLLLVEGLFLVVEALGPHGLDAALRSVAGVGGGFLGDLRLAGAAAAGSNLVNNLPAYLALDRVVPRHDLLPVLLGVDLGPLVLPWGSLATLLWAERCRQRGVEVPWRTFAVSGLLLMPVLLLATVATL